MENVDLSMIRRKLNFIFCNQFNGQTKNQTKLSLFPFSKIGYFKNEFQTPFGLSFKFYLIHTICVFIRISIHFFAHLFDALSHSFFYSFIYWFIDLLISSIAAIQSIYIALMVFVMYILLSTIIFNYLFIY